MIVFYVVKLNNDLTIRRDCMVWDFVVVGSGIVGLSTAYHLARLGRGLSILVLDKAGGPGAGDTSKSNSAFRAAFTNKLNLMLAKASIDFYEHVQRVEGFDLGMRFIGYLFAVDKSGLQNISRGVQVAMSLGVEVEEVPLDKLESGLGMRVHVSDDEEARLMGFNDIEKAFLFKRAGVLDADKLVKYYYEKARELGVQFSFNAEVKGFIVEPEKPLGIPNEPLPWEDIKVKGVVLSDGTVIRARGKVIAALGSSSFKLLNPIGVDSFSRPKKRQLFSIKVKDPELDKLLHAKGFNNEGFSPFIILPKGFLVRPNPTENAFWVGFSDELNRPFIFEEDPQPEDNFYKYGVLPVISLYLPQFRNKYYDAAWAGHYDISFDGLPVIYEPYNSNLIVSAGTSGSGIMKGDSIGRITASLALGLDEAELFDGSKVKVEWLGLENRHTEKELIIL